MSTALSRKPLESSSAIASSSAEVGGSVSAPVSMRSAPTSMTASSSVLFGTETLDRKTMYGFDPSVRNACFYVSEHRVVFTTGRCIIVFDTEHQEKSILPGSDNAEKITALACSSERRYVAVAERCDHGAQIFGIDIVTMKRRRTLVSDSITSKEYVSICFPRDRRLLYAISGAPDFELVVWSWEKGRVLATIPLLGPHEDPSAEPYEVKADPDESSVVSVCGHNLFKVFRLVENQLLPVNLSYGRFGLRSFLCHEWVLPSVIVVGTAEGEMLVMHNGEFKTSLAKPEETTSKILTISGHSKGFVCGCDGGVIAMFEKTRDHRFFRLFRAFKVEGQIADDGIDDALEKYTSPVGMIKRPLFSEVTTTIPVVAIHPSEEIILIGTGNRQLLLPNFTTLDIRKPEGIIFEPLLYSTHSKRITDIDTCVRKTTVATCSLDGSVRLWNYIEQTLEICHFFIEEALSLSLHPTGLFLLVGFSDKLRLLTIVMDTFREFKSWPLRNCLQCKFSRGGQYFAASFGNNVAIFDTYSCENTNIIRHPANRVTKLIWTEDDHSLITAGMDGSVVEWSTQTWERVNDFMSKSSPILSCAKDHDKIFVSSSDRVLRTLTDFQERPDDDPLVHVGDFSLLSMAISPTQELMFAGSEDGSIRTYKYKISTSAYTRMTCHVGPVSSLALSYDEGYLFTGGEDGTFCIFEITDTGIHNRREAPFLEEILISRSDLDDKDAILADLQAMLAERSADHDMAILQQRKQFEEEMKRRKDKFENDLEEEITKFEVLADEMDRLKRAHIDEVNQLQSKHALEIESLQDEFQRQHLIEVERRHDLQEEMDRQYREMKQEYRDVKVELETKRERMQQDYEEQLQQERNRIKELEILHAKEGQEHHFLLDQIEKDVDVEVEDLKRALTIELKHKQAENQDLRTEKLIFEKKIDTIQKALDSAHENLLNAAKREEDLRVALEKRIQDIKRCKAENSELNKILSEKEKKLHEEKRRVEELKKSTFVLEYKNTDLLNRTAPKDELINEQKAKIEALEQHTESLGKEKQLLTRQVAEGKSKLHASQDEITSLRSRLVDARTYKDRLKFDLTAVAEHFQDLKLFKSSFRDFCAKYLDSIGALENVESDQVVESETIRHREYLENQVSNLRYRLDKDVDAQKRENVRLLQENVDLLKQINGLRRQLQSLRKDDDPSRGSSTSRGTAGRSSRRESARSQPNLDLSVSSPSFGVKSSASRTVHAGRVSLTVSPREANKEIVLQKNEIERLRKRIQELESVPRSPQLSSLDVGSTSVHSSTSVRSPDEGINVSAPPLIVESTQSPKHRKMIERNFEDTTELENTPPHLNL